jgi:glucose-1-phosphate adenylyltransferase
VPDLGVLKVGADYDVLDFVEKPKEPAVIDRFEIPANLRPSSRDGRELTHMGSMGIYLFNKKVLFDLLEQFSYDDFGKQIIPAAITGHRVFAYPFTGYWEDIGTIKSFFEAHMALTSPNPPFDFYDQKKPIFTNRRHLPAAKITGSAIDSSIICEGSMIEHAQIAHSVIGVRSIIRQGTALSRVILMGADSYETGASKNPLMGIGRNCRISNAIIDKDVRIGDGVVLENTSNLAQGEKDGIFISDGIIIVPKSKRVPEGYVL